MFGWHPFKGLKATIKEAVQDIDGFSSSKRIALVYLCVLVGIGYVAHWTLGTGLDQIDKLIDLIKVDFAAISAEHLPRVAASFKSGDPPPGQGADAGDVPKPPQ